MSTVYCGKIESIVFLMCVLSLFFTFIRLPSNMLQAILVHTFYRIHWYMYGIRWYALSYNTHAPSVTVFLTNVILVLADLQGIRDLTKLCLVGLNDKKERIVAIVYSGICHLYRKREKVIACTKQY